MATSLNVTGDPAGLTPLSVGFGVASSGTNTVVAAVSGKSIRVLAIEGIATAAVTVYFKDSNGNVLWSTAANPQALAANGGFVLPYSPIGWMQTDPGATLQVVLGGAQAFSGGVVYQLV